MKTIMVVDDMAIFREPIAAVLRHRGYKAVEAATGREALEVARQSKPALILLDIAMPDLDGLKFLEIVSRDPILRKTPVILLTALRNRDAILSARKLGVEAYLLKSQFSLNDMMNRVEKFLGPPVQADDSPDADPSEDDIDFEAAGALAESSPHTASVEGLEEVREGMSPSEILEQIEQSEDLRELLEASEAGG